MKRTLLLLLLLPTTALAAPLQPRETADVRNKGAYSVGLFNPLRYAIRDGLELKAHPLLWAAAPHLTARVRHLDQGQDGWRIAGEYGLGLTVLAWTAAKPLGLSGDLVPSCKVAGKDDTLSHWCVRPEHVLVASLGVAASRDVGPAVLTLRADVAKGFGADEERPLDAWAPVNQQLAPWVGGMRGRLRVLYDRPLTDWLRARGELGGYRVHQPAASELSPWTMSAYIGADLRTTTHTRLTLGAVWWNSDTHGIEVVKGADGYATVERVRTNEVWPTVDFIWMY